MSELNIPEHWAETTLGVISEKISYGATASSSASGEFKFLRITDLTEEGVNWSSVPFCNIENGQRYMLNNGDIVIARTGGTVGKSYRIMHPPENAIFASYLIKIQPKTPFEINEYLSLFFKSKLYWDEIQDKAQGAAQPNVNASKLAEIKIPIPPIGEQELIIKKIETCFQKIDETEEALKEVEVLLMKYRESLLSKAFRGELIPQDSKDEPASKLLEKIRSERAKNSNGKKTQGFQPIEDDEKPFDLPKGWEWVRLGEIIEFRRGHNPPKSDFKYKPLKGFVRFIQIQYFKSDERAVYVPQTDNLKLCKRGDIMVSAYRHVGKYSREMEGAFNVALCHFSPHELIHDDYIESMMPTNYITGALLAVSERSMIPSMSVEVAAKLVVPLAPFNQQFKISKLLKKNKSDLESFRQDIEKKKNLIKSFRNSILSSAFEGRLVKRIDSEGTGHELLEKILKSGREEVTKAPEKKVFKQKPKHTAKKKAKK